MTSLLIDINIPEGSETCEGCGRPQRRKFYWLCGANGQHLSGVYPVLKRNKSCLAAEQKAKALKDELET